MSNRMHESHIVILQRVKISDVREKEKKEKEKQKKRDYYYIFITQIQFDQI